jgi:hypothetical protein
MTNSSAVGTSVVFWWLCFMVWRFVLMNLTPQTDTHRILGIWQQLSDDFCLEWPLLITQELLTLTQYGVFILLACTLFFSRSMWLIHSSLLNLYSMITFSEKTFLFSFLGGIGVWTQSFTLAKQVLYHLNHTFSPFLLWSSFGDSVWRTVCLGWSQTTILPISASQTARITGMSHWQQERRLS